MTCYPNLIAIVSLALGGITVAAESPHPLFSAELTVKEGYDSNVYLQDVNPSAANVAAAKAAGLHPIGANQGSWITTVQPKVGLSYELSSALRLDASYAPEVTFYHDQPGEDYVAHRAGLDLRGTHEHTAWEFLNSANYIDGSTDGPTFARPSDIPAIGGIPLRDRRAAFIFKNGFRFTQSLGNWFVRPVASSYVHDFKTDQLYVPPAIRSRTYSYENYIDRQDISGGLDVGYQVAAGTHLVLGYRYGRQDQFKGPYGPGGAVIDSPFDSAYHRVLLGVEGSPADWLRLNMCFGPDLRQFSPDAVRLYPNFHPDELLYYVDASITLLPTKQDRITLKTARFEQPAFSSFSMYEDVKSELTWRRQWCGSFSSTLGFTLWIAQWQPPVNRDDWVYTPNLSLAYAVNRHLTLELCASYDWTDSKVPEAVEPLTRSHEFTRDLVFLGAHYVF